MKKQYYFLQVIGCAFLIMAFLLISRLYCSPAVHFKVRTVDIKIAADDDFRKQPRWRMDIERWMQSISTLFEKEFGIRFVIQSFVNWESCCLGNSLEETFQDLRRKIPLEKSDVVLGFTDRSDLLSPTMGLASYLQGYVLLKKGSSESQTERYLLHEICHLFGGVDLSRTNSIMRWDNPTKHFDDTTRQLILLNRIRRFNPNVFPLPADKVDEAISIYEEIDESKQKDDVVPVILASLYLEKEDYASMMTTCKRAKNNFPDSVETSHLLGIAYRRMGHVDLAIAEYLNVIQLQPWLPDVYYNLGIAYKKKGQLIDAAQAYLRSIELNPHHAKAHSNLGLVYLEQNHPERAIAECQKAISLYPCLAEAYSTLGGAFLLMDRLDKAEEHSLKALSLNAELPGAHNNLGTIYVKQKKIDQAIRMYKRSIELNPGYHEALYNLGRVFYLKGSFDEAIEYFLEAIKKKPDYYQAYSNLGVAYLKKDMIRESVEACLNAIAIKSDHANAYSTLGFVYFLQEKWDQAEAAAMKTIELSPSLPEAYNLLGIIYEKKGRDSEAEGKYLHAADLKPDYLEAHLNLGNFYFKKNLFDRALTHYHKGLKIDPGQALIWNNTAVIYYLKERYSKAWEYLKKAEELGHTVHPDFKRQLERKLKSIHPSLSPYSFPSR